MPVISNKKTPAGSPEGFLPGRMQPDLARIVVSVA
jgi:hypothetical protein